MNDYLNVIPNSHFYTELEQIKRCIDDQDNFSRNYIKIGIENTIENGYELTLNKLYELIYNENMWESGWVTLSIHRTKEGAEIAMMEHKKEIYKDWEEYSRPRTEEYRKEFPYDFGKGWAVQQIEIKE